MGLGMVGLPSTAIARVVPFLPTSLMECFGMQDGRDFPYSDIYGAGKNPNGVDIFADRDPRLYETMMVPRQSLPAGFDYAGFKYIDSWEGGAMYYDKSNFGDAEGDDGASRYRKFKWMLDYTSGRMDDEYIGVSYIRLAEMYLIRAEAKAETGDLQGALDDLHIVRSRVGLGRLEKMNPELNLTSNKENLINEILRERNCEIGAECGDRLYDMVRRMRQDLFTKPLHEIRVYRLDANGNRLTSGDQRGRGNTFTKVRIREDSDCKRCSPLVGSRLLDQQVVSRPRISYRDSERIWTYSESWMVNSNLIIKS